MNTLRELPNIGSTLHQKLLQAGIHSPDELIRTGSRQALLLIREKDQSACFNMLCALEGAIQGIRWHKLSKQQREELKNFLRENKITMNTEQK